MRLRQLWYCNFTGNVLNHSLEVNAYNLYSHVKPQSNLRTSQPNFRSLAFICTGTGNNCQAWRDEGKIGTETLMVDPDGSGPLLPVPTLCVLHANPPAAYMVRHVAHTRAKYYIL